MYTPVPVGQSVVYSTLVRLTFPAGFNATGLRIAGAGPDGVGTAAMAGNNKDEMNRYI